MDGDGWWWWWGDWVGANHVDRRQVNEETRLKQLQQWSEIILGFCRDVQVHTFDLNEALTWRLFNNTAIQRTDTKSCCARW